VATLRLLPSLRQQALQTFIMNHPGSIGIRTQLLSFEHPGMHIPQHLPLANAKSLGCLSCTEHYSSIPLIQH
jgi:hypothetical protein